MARGKKIVKELSPEERLEQALVPVEEQPYSIPENWCWEYGASIFMPMEAQKPRGEMFRYIDIDSIDNKQQVVSEPKEMSAIKAPSRASRKLHNGDTIFSMVRPYLKNIAYIDEMMSDSIASTGFYICTPRENVNNRYNYYMMISPYVIDGLNAFMKGDNSPSIRKDDIEGFPYPIPPLSEQQRIVDRIESLFAKLDETKEKAQAVVDGFELRKSAILHKAFTGELTKQWRKEHGVGLDSWDTQAFGMLTENHDAKRIPLSQVQRANMNRKYDYYGASGVIDQVEDYLFEGRYLLIGEDGANLMTRSKPIAFIAEGQYWVNNHAHVLATNSHMNLDYLCYYINSIDLIPYVTGSAQPKLTQNNMNAIPVPVPSVREQGQIVLILDKIFTQEQQAKEATEAVLSHIDTMKKAILARAFRGELGTNDPAEEWAGELVKAIL